MAAVKALLMDVDGTIVDTDHLHYRAMCSAMTKHGLLRMDYREDPALRPHSMRVRLRAAGVPEDMLETVYADKRAFFKSMLSELRPADGIRGKLRAAAQKYRLIAVSNSTAASAVLQAVGVLGLFERVVTPAPGEPGKPNPHVYLRALRLGGLKPSEVAVFEDTQAGIDAALQAFIPSNLICRTSVDRLPGELRKWL